MNLRDLELARRRANAQMRAGYCPPSECPPAELAERPLNPNKVNCETPRIWYVVSSRNPDGTAKAATVFPAGALFTQGFDFEVPMGMCLWSLGVDYTSADPLAVGMVQIGANNPPIPVRTGITFNLDTDEFPCELCGPLRVTIRGGSIPGDPAIPLPVNWYAIIGEPGDDV